MHPLLRPATRSDMEKIKTLYQEVTAAPHGLARTPSEVDLKYIQDFVEESISRGLIWVAVENNQLIGEIHGYSLSPALFRHTLTNITFVIHPQWQKKGVGRLLFGKFMEEIQINMPFIMRVELITQEKNLRAIHLYESFGFKREGVMEKRIWKDGVFANDTLYAWLRT